MSLTHMKVFNEFIMPATIETLDQMVQAFNEASGGTIRLTTEGFTGDFLQESFFAALHSAQRRVDRYAANGDAPVTDLTQLQMNGVKVAGGFGPVKFEPAQLTWLEKPTDEGIEVISRNCAEAIMQDQLNTAILALVAAISAQSAAKNDVSAVSPAKGITFSVLNSAHAKFGDQSGSLKTHVMTGGVFHKLIGQNLNNANRLFQTRNVNVVDLLGKMYIVTDAPALYEDSSPKDFEKVLTITEGAATVFDGSDMIANVETRNGKERIETTMQWDYSFGVALKGYSWDTQAGGKSPTNSELGTGSNWVKTATSIKHTAGVIAIGDASADNV